MFNTNRHFCKYLSGPFQLILIIDCQNPYLKPWQYDIIAMINLTYILSMNIYKQWWKTWKQLCTLPLCPSCRNCVRVLELDYPGTGRDNSVTLFHFDHLIPSSWCCWCKRSWGLKHKQLFDEKQILDTKTIRNLWNTW